MGELLMECPATPTETQLVVSFLIDDSRNMTLECWFANNPAVRGTVTLNAKTISRDNMHLIERTETAVSAAGERLRLEDRAVFLRKKQTLLDLCEAYWSAPSEDARRQIVELGNELKTGVRALEQKYQL
jgi:hypothetical protein